MRLGNTKIVTIIFTVSVILVALFIAFILLLIRALLKYLRSEKSDQVPPETEALIKSLGEAIRERRIACGMTQEFVADSLGISRQAVSKWENGNSEPSTSNLYALAELYGVSVEDLLRDVNR